MDDKLVKLASDWDCRAISENFLNKFKKDYVGKTRKASDVSFYPFVELVKAHNELVFCFRGNGNPERVSIYMNNHSVFTITSGTLYINPHYFRFCKDWESRLERLVSEFKFSNGYLPPQITRRLNERSGKYSYSAKLDKTSLSRAIDRELLDSLEDLYSFFKEALDVFFEKDKYRDDQFLLWGKSNSEFGDSITQKVAKDGLPYKKYELEKIRQQQLFNCMRNQLSGYYFYDMEFDQRHHSKDEKSDDIEKNISNKPDMQAIRFEDGEPKALVFVEVKCTPEAYGGKSGLKKHIDSMRLYPTEDKLKARRREAALMLHQYQELGLMNLNRNIAVEEYENLDLEAILVFTDDAIKCWTEDQLPENVELREKQLNHIGNEIIDKEIGSIIIAEDK